MPYLPSTKVTEAKLKEHLTLKSKIANQHIFEKLFIQKINKPARSQ